MRVLTKVGNNTCIKGYNDFSRTNYQLGKLDIRYTVCRSRDHTLCKTSP